MRRSVLIADDDRPLLSLLRTIVSRSGDFDIVTCQDGEEAIEALALRHYDVVLLDLMMPRRSGFEVLDYMREKRPEQLRVVVVLSAAPDQLAQARWCRRTRRGLETVRRSRARRLDQPDTRSCRRSVALNRMLRIL